MHGSTQILSMQVFYSIPHNGGTKDSMQRSSMRSIKSSGEVFVNSNSDNKVGGGLGKLFGKLQTLIYKHFSLMMICVFHICQRLLPINHLLSWGLTMWLALLTEAPYTPTLLYLPYYYKMDFI
ncbi:hypothetical protein KSP39_PZI003547 [Platanthera zijinensis]|uniref:Uncharacterized protein n=1 Tax=Platanthera zijinensis TaxID=2320716 RepID=A0AAP0BW07_9ASPA